MANNFYGAILLTGGGTGALDAISIAGLADLDAAFVQSDGIVYLYHFDATATDAESSPAFIRPDDYATAGVWILQSVQVKRLLLPLVNDAANPSLAFGDGNTGFYEENDNQISIAVDGNKISHINVTENRSNTSGGYFLKHEPGSSTVPVFAIRGDINTGIGYSAADQLSLIAGGVQVANLIESAGVVQMILPLQNDPANPSLAFGDGDTGFYERIDDQLAVAIDGAFRTWWDTAKFHSTTNFGFACIYEASSSTVPAHAFFTDENTGIGRAGADQLSLIAGGVEGLRITEAASIVTLKSEGATTIDSNAANTAKIISFENTAGSVDLFRVDADPEGVVTGSIGDMCIDGTNGLLYLKKSGSATNTGWIVTGGTPAFKSYSLSNPGTADTFYIGGHYAFNAAHAILTIGGTVVQTFGNAGEAHGAHAFIVAEGAGGTDLVLTVTGVSITDAGVKNDSDTEVIVADADTASVNDYFETTKKWLGEVTYTLTGSSGAFTFNYGFVKYEDFGNRSFILTDFEATGEARANETGLNIELLHHEPTAFVYSAAAFEPNLTALISLATDYGTNNDVASGDGFAYKRAGLSTAIDGNSGEGLIIRVTTVVNNSINDASFHIGVNLN